MAEREDSEPAGPASGAVLVGGVSRRMGRDKARLRLQGMTLAERAVQALGRVCDEVLLAGECPGLTLPGIPRHSDRRPGSSLGGLQTALAAAAHDWVCVLPCDLPFPSPELLRTLLQAREGVQAVIAAPASGPEPLVACYHRSVLPAIERRLEEGDLRLTALLAELRVRRLREEELPTGWRRGLRNLNTPAELRRALAPPPAVAFVARSGTGKTTLLEKLIAGLGRRGWTVGALKHDAHRFEIDHPGKDSWRLRRAGAAVTAIAAADRRAVIVEQQLAPPLGQLLEPFRGLVDLVLTEGFRASRLPRIELHRTDLGQELLCRGERRDPDLIAVVSDGRPEVDVPLFDLNRPEALLEFLEERFLT